MHTHRLLIGLLALCGLVLALAGSVVLNGAAVLAVVVPAALVAAAVLSAGKERRAAAAWTAGAGTAAAIMMLVGVGVLAGSAMALRISVLLAMVPPVRWLVRKLRARAVGPRSFPCWPAASEGVSDAKWALRPDTLPALVRLLSSSVLGHEWRRTTAALAAGPAPAARQALVARRAEVLQEMERRDPVGIQRWLAVAADHPDPAEFFHPGRNGGTGAGSG